MHISDAYGLLTRVSRFACPGMPPYTPEGRPTMDDKEDNALKGLEGNYDNPTGSKLTKSTKQMLRAAEDFLARHPDKTNNLSK